METRIVQRISALCAGMLVLAGMVAGQDGLSAGTYKGQWSGTSGGGDIRLTFRMNEGKMTAEAGFTLGGQDVACKTLSFKPDGAKFAMVYEFDAQGTMLQSAIEGTVKGKTIEGTYKTTAADQGVDNGTWKATAQ